jgi:hypothetical protein
MNRDFLKHFILILIILVLCSGCGQSNIMSGDFLTIPTENNINAVKYKNGAILVKNNDMTNRKNFVNPENNVESIKFGPKNINFDN